MSQQLDLIVWTGFLGLGRPSGFQLCYDKDGEERAVMWKSGKGWSHWQVDNGSGISGDNKTPLLYLSGPFDAARVARVFAAQSDDVPLKLRNFVLERLEENPYFLSGAPADFETGRPG